MFSTSFACQAPQYSEHTGHLLQFQVQSWLWNISLYTGSESRPVEILYSGLTKTTLTKKIKSSIFTVFFFFIQVLSTLTLTAIKLRLDKIALFPHLLKRVDGLNHYLGPHAQASGYFWKRRCFSLFSKKCASTLSVLDSLPPVHTKTLKKWQYDSIPCMACA